MRRNKQEILRRRRRHMERRARNRERRLTLADGAGGVILCGTAGAAYATAPSGLWIDRSTQRCLKVTLGLIAVFFVCVWLSWLQTGTIVAQADGALSVVRSLVGISAAIALFLSLISMPPETPDWRIEIRLTFGFVVALAFLLTGVAVYLIFNYLWGISLHETVQGWWLHFWGGLVIANFVLIVFGDGA